MENFEFDWEVLEIFTPDGEENDRRGAMVKYTPLLAGLSETEIFVPIPWHKASDITHAREIMERKIGSYAPAHIWNKELNPDPPDKSTEILAELDVDKPTGESRRESNVDTERGADSGNIPEPGGP